MITVDFANDDRRQAREQELAQREAEIERRAYEQAMALKTQQEAQLRQLADKETALAASHMQLSEMEARQKAELERALAMQKQAEERMMEAARLQGQMMRVLFFVLFRLC